MSTFRSRVVKGAICFSAVVLCSACEPKPTVQYGLNSAPDPAGLIKFRLAKSAVVVDYGKSPDGKSVDKARISLVPVPQEDSARTYTIGETSGLLAATHLKVVKRENTDLLQSIGVEVEDRRVELIQQVGAFAGAVIGGIGFFAAKTEVTEPVLPQAIDVSSFISTAGPGEGTFNGKLGDVWSYTFTIGAVPKDAYSTEDYVAAFDKGVKSNVLFYSACRDATITFTNGTFKDKSFSMKVSDPKFIQTIAMPTKGAISFHSSCGVNVSSEKSGTATTMEVLNALMNQAKTLLESTKKKK